MKKFVLAFIVVFCLCAVSQAGNGYNPFAVRQRVIVQPQFQQQYFQQQNVGGCYDPFTLQGYQQGFQQQRFRSSFRTRGFVPAPVVVPVRQRGIQFQRGLFGQRSITIFR